MANLTDLSIGPTGLKLLSVQAYAKPKLSIDGGLTWNEIAALSATPSYTCCAIGSDDLTMLVGDWDGNLWLSLNGGSSWSSVPGPIAGAWGSVYGVGIAGDNQTMVLNQLYGRCYKTTNQWSSYAEIRPLGDIDADWCKIAISENGLLILICNLNRLYLSTDGGATDNWPETQPVGDVNRFWCGVAVGQDNSSMMVCEQEGQVFRSSNIGANWYPEDISGVTPYYWRVVALGGEDLWGAAAGDPDELDSHVFRGRYFALPEGAPAGPPVFPVIDKLGIEGYHAQLDVDEVEVLELPAESDFVDINT